MRLVALYPYQNKKFVLKKRTRLGSKNQNIKWTPPPPKGWNVFWFFLADELNEIYIPNLVKTELKFRPLFREQGFDGNVVVWIWSHHDDYSNSLFLEPNPNQINNFERTLKHMSSRLRKRDFSKRKKKERKKKDCNNIKYKTIFLLLNCDYLLYLVGYHWLYAGTVFRMDFRGWCSSRRQQSLTL